MLSGLHKRRPNGIISKLSSELCCNLTSSSSFSSSDEWSDQDFEDPLWVKDENLKPRSTRRFWGKKKNASQSSPLSSCIPPASSSSSASVPQRNHAGRPMSRRALREHRLVQQPSSLHTSRSKAEAPWWLPWKKNKKASNSWFHGLIPQIWRKHSREGKGEQRNRS